MIALNDPVIIETMIVDGGVAFNPMCNVCFGRIENGVVYGGVVYEKYTQASIWMHTAGFRPNWLNRDLLYVSFHYPFEQLHVKKIFVQIANSNCKSLEFATSLGFKIVAELDDVFPDGGCAILAMGKSECRWLRIRPRSVRPGGLYEQEPSSTAAGL